MITLDAEGGRWAKAGKSKPKSMVKHYVVVER